MDPSEPTSTIDNLLARYLLLLDEYTTLRADLSRLQAATFQHLARANFAAERGIRYGADQYDERMQASRTVAVGDHDMHDVGVSGDGDGKNGMANVGSSAGTGVEFRVVTKSAGKHDDDDEKEQEKQKQQQQDEKQKPTEEAEAEVDEDKRAKTSTTDTTENPLDIDTHSNEQQDKKDKSTSPPVPVDPLRWFGVLTPLALRQTQACAVEVVERIVPRLVTVDAAMREVEIEVRRAKKRRAKREAATAAAAVPSLLAATKDVEAPQQDTPDVVHSAEAAAV